MILVKERPNQDNMSVFVGFFNNKKINKNVILIRLIYIRTVISVWNAKDKKKINTGFLCQ